MEFQVQCVYLMYTWLIVYAILNLAYSKEYVYYMPLIYSITLLFWNLLCDIWLCNCDIWQFVAVIYDITLAPNSKFKK